MKTILAAFLLFNVTASAQYLVFGGFPPDLEPDTPTAPALVDPRYVESAGKFLNLSTRGEVSAPGHAMTAGLVVRGGSRTVMVRAIGPGLEAFDVPEPLLVPTLSIQMPDGSLVATGIPFAQVSASSRAAIRNVETITGAFPLEDGKSDIAIVLHLEEGIYTCSVDSASGGGSVLVEIYEVPVQQLSP